MPEYRFLFKKTSTFTRSTATWKTAKVIEKYISNYQDEVGKEAANLKRGRDRAYEGKHENSKKQKTSFWKNPKTHNTGVLWAGGFFGNIRSPGKAKPNHQKAWIQRFVKDWGTKLREMNKRKNDGTRMVLAISKKTVEELTQCGIPADIFIQEILQDGMDIYAKRHNWKREDIGWMAGYHHDNEHLHLHVLIFPTTKTGQPLRLSNGNEKDGIVRNDLTDLTGAVNVAAERYYQLYLPYRVQNPEVQLAWWKGQEAPMTRIEDYRVENPLPMKYMIPEEKKEISKLRKEADTRRKQAIESLEIEKSKNPSREKELHEIIRPLLEPPQNQLLQQLIRSFLWDKTTEEQKDALKEGKKTINPESTDIEEAQRATELLSYQLTAGNSHLTKLEEEIEETIAHLNEQMERNRKKESSQPTERVIQLATATWNNTKLGLAKWRLNKYKDILQEPSTRARVLVNLTLAHIEIIQSTDLTETETGLEHLKTFAREQADDYQKRADGILKNTTDEPSGGKKIYTIIQEITKSIPKGKKELAWMNTLKGILKKTRKPGKPLKEINLLLAGTKLRLQIIRDQKEFYRAMIRLRGKNKEPVPARIKKVIEPDSNTGARTKEKGFQLLKLPKFLDPSRIITLLTERIEEVQTQKEKGTKLDISTTPKEKADPLAKWKHLGEKSSLQSIILEMERRKSKDKETP